MPFKYSLIHSIFWIDWDDGFKLVVGIGGLLDSVGLVFEGRLLGVGELDPAVGVGVFYGHDVAEALHDRKFEVNIIEICVADDFGKGPHLVMKLGHRFASLESVSGILILIDKSHVNRLFGTCLKVSRSFLECSAICWNLFPLATSPVLRK